MWRDLFLPFWGGGHGEEHVLFCVAPQAGFIKSRGDSDNHSSTASGNS